MIRDAELLLERLRQVHESIRDAVVAACEQQALETLSAVADESGAGDVSFAIDRVSEEALRHHFDEIAQTWSCVLIAEGLAGDGRLVLPAGRSASDTELSFIVDPIDGTCGLVYPK